MGSDKKEKSKDKDKDKKKKDKEKSSSKDKEKKDKSSSSKSKDKDKKDKEKGKDKESSKEKKEKSSSSSKDKDSKDKKEKKSKSSSSSAAEPAAPAPAQAPPAPSAAMPSPSEGNYSTIGSVSAAAPGSRIDPAMLAFYSWAKPEMQQNWGDFAHQVADTKTMEQFKLRMSELYYIINTYLIPKRYQVLSYLFQVSQKVKEVQGGKLNIIRETQEAVQAILARLDRQEQSKLNVLNEDMAQLYKYLDDIYTFVDRMSHALPYVQGSPLYMPMPGQHPDLLSSVSYYQYQPKAAGPVPSLLGTNPFLDVHDFVRNYQQYVNECEYLLRRPVKTSAALDIPTNDFDHEMTRLIRIERSFNEMKQMVDDKNRTIQQLTTQLNDLRKYRDMEVTQLTNLYKSSKRELKNWIEMSSSSAKTTPYGSVAVASVLPNKYATINTYLNSGGDGLLKRGY